MSTSTLQALIGLIICLQLPTVLSIIQLLGLHMWLIHRGMTTYAWIMSNRARAAAKIKKNQVAPDDGKGSVEMGTTRAWSAGEEETIVGL